MSEIHCKRSRSSYVAGCRCPWCRDANQQYMQKYRRCGLELVVPDRTWVALAACRGLGHDVFFSDDPADRDVARSACAVCPVKQECRAYADALPDLVGFWAGRVRTPRKRRS